MKKQGCVLIVLGVLAGMVFATSQETFAASPSDDCALLTPAQVEKVVGQPFGAPKKIALIPPFGNKWGSHCIYKSLKDENVVVDFLVYVTASPAQAKQWFDMGAAAGKQKSKPAIGDSAYVDSNEEVYVVKSNVLYSITMARGNLKQKQDLAASVASRI